MIVILFDFLLNSHIKSKHAVDLLHLCVSRSDVLFGCCNDNSLNDIIIFDLAMWDWNQFSGSKEQICGGLPCFAWNLQLARNHVSWYVHTITTNYRRINPSVVNKDELPAMFCITTYIQIYVHFSKLCAFVYSYPLQEIQLPFAWLSCNSIDCYYRRYHVCMHMWMSIATGRDPVKKVHCHFFMMVNYYSKYRHTAMSPL